MLNILSAFVEAIIAQIVQRSSDYAHNRLDARRIILSKLLTLYNSLQELRISSQRTLQEFEGYANKSETPTKVVSAKRLADLAAEFFAFRKAKSEVTKTLELFDGDLTILLSRSENLKWSFFWNIINLSEELVPKMKDESELRTFTLRYPTHLPSDELAPVIDPSIDSREDLAEKTDAVRQRALAKFKFLEIDIRDTESLDAALAEAKLAIDTMVKAEEDIASLVRNKFTIDQVFEATKDR